MLKHLRPLDRNNEIDLWVDEGIEPGEKWDEFIEEGLGSSRIAILLVSQNFQDSPFIAQNELPRLKAAAATGELKLYWVPVTDCIITDEISEFQAASNPAAPLDGLPESNRNSIFAALARELREQVGKLKAEQAAKIAEAEQAAYLASPEYQIAKKKKEKEAARRAKKESAKRKRQKRTEKRREFWNNLKTKLKKGEQEPEASKAKRQARKEDRAVGRKKFFSRLRDFKWKELPRKKIVALLLALTGIIGVFIVSNSHTLFVPASAPHNIKVKQLNRNSKLYISRTPVSEKDFASYANASEQNRRFTGWESLQNHINPSSSKPMDDLTWFEAQKYCDWVDSEAPGRWRLPTPMELNVADPLSKSEWGKDSSGGFEYSGRVTRRTKIHRSPRAVFRIICEK